MSLYIQDPNDPKGTYLLEALLEACEGAQAGGGAFAFVSSEGVKLFLEDKGFQTFASKNRFDLVIGVDAITNTKSLGAIERASKVSKGLAPSVFVPAKAGTIFHPKFSWFRKSKGGVLIAGSGNMTRGGLRWNVEAFTWQMLSTGDVKVLEKRWNDFRRSNAMRLKGLDDPIVVERAKANDIVQRIVAETRENVVPDEVKERDPERAETAPTATDPVLIYEIPASKTRWKQANFHKETFEAYFGATPGKVQRILLYHVKDNGALDEREVRPSVAVASHNFRFELGAAGNLDYPKVGRPIGVFIRMATRTFRYRLLMPSDPQHKLIEAYLTKRSGAAGRIMRETYTTVAELQKVWPAAPFWKKP